MVALPSKVIKEIKLETKKLPKKLSFEIFPSPKKVCDLKKI